MSEEKIEKLYYPCCTDKMWNDEVQKLMPYLFGKGVDVGCSNRSPKSDQIRVDINPKMNPDYVADADKLPFEDKEFDYLTAIHVLEHFPDTKKALLEWRRVVKDHGIIAIVYPDVEHTGVQTEEKLESAHNPFYKHYHEKTYKEFLDWFETIKPCGLEIIDSGVACGEWSFYVIFKRNIHII